MFGKTLLEKLIVFDWLRRVVGDLFEGNEAPAGYGSVSTPHQPAQYGCKKIICFFRPHAMEICHQPAKTKAAFIYRVGCAFGHRIALAGTPHPKARVEKRRAVPSRLARVLSEWSALR